MRIIRALRMLTRRLTPPGNRESLDTSYRQPKLTGNGTSTPSAAAGHEKGV
jgi:hypothetical protein